MAKKDIEGKALSQTSVESEKTANQQSQKESSLQSLKSASKSVDSNNEKSTQKLSTIEQAINSDQNPIEVDSNVNDEAVKSRQNETGITKPETRFPSATSSQNANKILSSANVEQTVTEDENQSNAKLVDQLIEQSKDLGVGENKDVIAKEPAKTNTGFSINNQFMDATSRVTQAAYDRVDQQAAEIHNLTGSSEVSQSQKTNTQLHQETISIFRKDFSDAVKDKVMLVISQKLQQFDITLDPPELGNMQIRVNLQGEQASVNFVVQNQQAKDALEQNMHKLRDLLEEQGVDVGDANVEQQSQQSDKEENAEKNHLNSMINTADASDVIEHNLSAKMFNSSATAVDYYA